MTRISHTPELAAPTLVCAQKTGINLATAAHLLIDVSPYPDMDVGDLIELFWNKCYVASKVLSAADVGDSVSLRVPESFITNGTARIHYRVMQVGQGPALSAATRVQVKLDCPGGQPTAQCEDENQRLAPVVIPEAIRRQGVNPSQIKRGVPLTIEPYLNMAEDDAITLRWGDTRMDLAPITAADVGLPIQVWVPRSRRRPAAGCDVLHPRSGRQQFTLGAAAYVENRLCEFICESPIEARIQGRRNARQMSSGRGERHVLSLATR